MPKNPYRGINMVWNRKYLIPAMNMQLFKRSAREQNGGSFWGNFDTVLPNGSFLRTSFSFSILLKDYFELLIITAFLPLTISVLSPILIIFDNSHYHDG